MSTGIIRIHPGLDAFTIGGTYIPYLDVYADDEETALKVAGKIMSDFNKFGSDNSLGSMERIAITDSIGNAARWTNIMSTRDIMQRIKHTALRITKDDFSKAFGDNRGQHLYRKFLTYDQNIMTLYNELDDTCQTIMCCVIETLGK